MSQERGAGFSVAFGGLCVGFVGVLGAGGAFGYVGAVSPVFAGLVLLVRGGS